VIRRLRTVSEEERLALYPQPYNHWHWEEHVTRVQRTIDVGAEFARAIKAERLIDLSCGDAAIPQGIAARVPLRRVTLGSLVHRTDVALDVIGSIEDTLPLHISPGPCRAYDLAVCTETIEHLENPTEILRLYRQCADHLLLSTPDTENGIYNNDEHLWEWDQSGIAEMIHEAGWDFGTCELLECKRYTYQIWMCT